MAIETRTWESTYVERYFMLDGIRMVEVTFGNGYGMDPHTRCKKLQSEGKACAVVTKQYTRRGKAGKVKEVELSRTDYPVEQ